MAKKISLEKEMEVLSTFSEIGSVSKTSSKIGVSLSTVYRVLNDHNIQLKPISYQFDKYKGSDCFTDFNREQDSYFYGLILTDGNISSPESNARKIQIALQQKDRHILESLKSYLKSDNKLVDFEKGELRYTHFGVGSETLYNRLVDLGCSWRKSTKEKLPKFEWENNRHFWRGVIDGDGCLMYMSGVPKIRLIGSLEVTEGFNLFCWKHCFTQKRTLIKHPKTEGLFTIDFNGEEALQIAKVLYHDCNLKLDRKYRKYLTFVDHFESNRGNMKKGVSKTKYGTYQAHIKCDGIGLHLGTFKTYEEALAERLCAEVKYYGKTFWESSWHSMLFQL